MFLIKFKKLMLQKVNNWTFEVLIEDENWKANSMCVPPRFKTVEISERFLSL